MARSSYIYVVTSYGDVLAGFTVKHELVSWLGGRTYIPSCRVFRVPDNDFAGRRVTELYLSDLV